MNPKAQPRQAQVFSFMEGGGQVGALMRVHDWSKSPLGPPQGWPQSLRSVVGLLLTSKFPMFVAWGPELGFLYNDAYAEILAGKHPASLGARFEDIWREIWPDIKPLIDAALRGEGTYRQDLPLLMNRRGFDEQTWFTFSYSPVRDEQGDVAGMFCAVAETTAQYRFQIRQAFRLALEKRLQDLAEPEAVMAAAAEAIGRELGVDRVGYGEVDAAQEFITIERDWTRDGMPSVAGRHRLEDFGASIISGLKAGRTVSVPDVERDVLLRPSLPAFEGIQTRSVLGVPLIKAGRFTALLFIHHSGPRRWSEEDVTLLEEVADRTWAAVGRARAEAEQRRSERRFRALATAGTVSLFRMSPDWEQMFPIDDQGALTESPAPTERWLERYIPPEDRAAVSGAISAAIRERRVFSLEHPVRHADGSLGWTLTRVVPILSKEGRILEWFGAASDVTARRQAEERVREAEEQFRVLVENLPELAWSAGPDGAIDYFNQRWFEYTGSSREECLGWGWGALHDPEILPQTVARWKHSVSTGEPFEMEFPIRGADGVLRWFLSRGKPLQNARGEVVRWFGTSVNIDEQRRQAAALNEAIETRDTFLSVAGHELKTPLTPMALRLQAIARAVAQQPDSPFVRQVRAHTETARRQIDRLTALVNDLLDVSRISSGRFRMELEPADLGALVREVVTRFEPEAQQTGATLTLHVPDSLPTRTARLRVEQVVTNLVDNALKYGEGKPVTVSLERAGEQARLIVADAGIGIPTEHLSRIFDRFERAVSERHYGGLGLGLYISRTIVESLGGSITVRSAPGEGAEFTVLLPLQPSAPVEVPSGSRASAS
ncbi:MULTISPECIES: ATP-binding protein [Myxococcaceae]|uniref:ATP-binding protein n=1 Tax=Myxococcaceae TaxID=31 RepID=UPI00188F7750|nr:MULTISPECIES: ATP-binding protein [Myxococcaceae]MBF5045628.1 PAS domain-containing protein [Simulacricoccus sp. 17bor-14]